MNQQQILDRMQAIRERQESLLKVILAESDVESLTAHMAERDQLIIENGELGIKLVQLQQS